MGSDIKAGEVILPHGSVIGPAEVGLLATVGAAKLKARGCPVAAKSVILASFLSSGTSCRLQ